MITIYKRETISAILPRNILIGQVFSFDAETGKMCKSDHQKLRIDRVTYTWNQYCSVPGTYESRQDLRLATWRLHGGTIYTVLLGIPSSPARTSIRAVVSPLNWSAKTYVPKRTNKHISESSTTEEFLLLNFTSVKPLSRRSIAITAGTQLRVILEQHWTKHGQYDGTSSENQTVDHSKTKNVISI